MKYYVVREWLKRWIFTSRDECKNFVVWVKWARYKSFNSLTEAETALEKWFEPYYTKEKWFEKDIPFEKNSIAVDAACSRNPWITEYQWIDLVSGEKIFHTKLWEWTNKIWEFLALVHWLSYLKKTIQIRRFIQIPNELSSEFQNENVKQISKKHQIMQKFLI